VTAPRHAAPRETDVVIAGAGMAGLCAAITALEAGARVTVVEKGNRAGGTMRLSSGLIWTFREKEQLRIDVPGGDAALQDLVVDGLWEGLDWLEARDVELSDQRELMWYGSGRLSSPPQMTATLVERLVQLGGDLRLETPLIGLRETGGRVTGVRVAGPNGDGEIDADVVVLASGGFQGNTELLQRYATPHADRLYLRANPWSTGDGLLAATAIGGAATANLGEFYGHTLAAPPTRFNQTEFQEVGQRYGPVAVALNLDGRRFTDESAGTGEEHLNHAVASQREATAAYVVDAESAEASYYGSPIASVRIEQLVGRDGPVARSESLEGLSEAMAAWGIVAGSALATLTEYDAAIAAGTAERLDPPRRANHYRLATPPFHAVLVRPGITFTCGGLQVDTGMRVLRRQASVTTLPLVSAEPSELTHSAIEGLYAIGCDAGGFSAHGYMGGLSTALVTGRIAGGAAASGDGR
jgi:succinate dehydrogenase/fumarate reductase flavoprotein subunit